MKIRQIIGVLIMLSGAICFWLESADRSQADWKIDVLGILLVLAAFGQGSSSSEKTRTKAYHEAKYAAIVLQYYLNEPVFIHLSGRS